MENEIIIRNLPDDFYVPELCKEFGRFGNITSAWVQTDNSSKEACVAFEDGCSALEAAKQMNEKRVSGKNIEVTTSYENQRFKKVFIKSFSSTWGEDDLIKAFKQFGPVTKAQVSNDSSGKSNGYGFVEFESHFAAKRAIAAMNGTVIGGHEMMVERFKSKTERDNLNLNSLELIERQLQESVQKDNLLVKNLPPDMEERELRKLFQEFGNILSVKVMTDNRGNSKGFGFVSFERKTDAARALKKRNGYSVRGGRILQVHFKEDKELRERRKRLKNMEEQKAVRNQYKARSKSVSYLFGKV